MNWYIKSLSQQQPLWQNDPKLQDVMRQHDAQISFEPSGSLETDLEEYATSYETALMILSHYGVQYEKIDFPRADSILLVNYGGLPHVLEMSFPYPDFEKAEEWLSNIHDPYNYVDERDMNKEFWLDVSPGFVVYHGTQEDRLESIQREGLSAMDETRGLSNRNTGLAVFTSPNPETAEYAYPVVIAIDVWAMKESGYTPQVGVEEPVSEAEMYEALASKVGLEDYYHEVEQGIDPGTVVFYDSIPPQFLRVL